MHRLITLFRQTTIPGSRGTFALLALVVLAFGLLGAPRHAEAKYAAFAIDVESGTVLHQTNADTKNFPASLTKMMTLYLLFEALDSGKVTLNTKMKVSAHAAKQQPSKIGVKAGSTITVEQAIRALVVKSANDVAVVVAEHLGKTESGFAKAMTKKAKALGMSRTVFQNASGLPNSKQVSTARDMATLSIALLDDFPQYYHYFSTQSFTYKGKTYSSHNAMLKNTPGVDGLKTGYTKASGFNIAVTAVRDGRRVVVVVFGGKTAAARNNQADSILNAAYVSLKKMDLPKTQVAKAKTPAAPAVVPPEKPVTGVILEPPPPSTIAEIEVASLGDMTLPSSPQPIIPQQAALPQAAALPATITAPPSGWSVQVGAFSKPASAEQAAEKAGGAAAKALGQARIYVMEVQAQNGTLYRARLTDLSETDAREACRQLSKSGQDCLVVAPGG